MRCLCAVMIVCATTPALAAETAGGRMLEGDGKRTIDVPLEHTAVRIRVDGPMVDATVVQTFRNPYDRPIEAVYLFPLPTGAAVQSMAIRHDGRTIEGVIRRRDQARAVYERAKQRGQVAALLDQERPNLFTQSVTGIAPGARVEVTLRYVEALAQRDGGHELVFPMVAPPRYLPGAARDATVQPAVLPADVRSSHDIEVAVEVDAGVPLLGLSSPSHALVVDRHPSLPAVASIRLAAGDTVPNRDFVLRWQVAGARPELALLAHRQGDGPGSFLLLAQPPAALADAEAAPREIIFVIDTSTSMSGAPLRTAVALVRTVLAGLRADDTYQIVRFSDAAAALGPGPLAARPRNLDYTGAWLDQLRAGGGTEMTAGIAAALAVPHDPARLRIVAFLTDGYVGNEDQILELVGRRMGASRLFAFGVGSAVNRYLLEEMALVGRGALQVVSPADDPAAAAARFAARIDRAVLTDVTIDWGDLPVTGVTPARVPDLFVGEPLILSGSYGRATAGQVVVRARRAGRPVELRLPVSLPAAADRPAVATVGARRRIAELSRALVRRADPALVDEITRIGLEHRLVTRYTSFVAVDPQAAVRGPVQRVVVPVEVTAAAQRGLASAGSGGLGAMGVGSYGAVGYGSGSGYGSAVGSVVMAGRAASRPVVAPQVRIGNAIAIGSLDKNIIRRYVRQRINAIRYCYEKQLVREPTLAGTVTTRFTIQSTGVVSEVTADGLGRPAVESCIAGVIRSIQFPISDGGGLVKVTYPFELKPEE